MRILVCDDCEITRTFWKDCLGSYGRIDLTSTGAQALILFKQALDHDHPYDLICLDVMLPKMNGYTVLQSIRMMEQHVGTRTKVMMATAKDSVRDYVNAYKIGCEAYVTKPLDKEMILRELDRLEIRPRTCV